MQQVRCTNCGSNAIIPDGSGNFYKCEACGSTFYVPKAEAFSKVELDHGNDVKIWREYLAKQLRMQSESSKARDYSGVKLFAQKILSVLPDDFCALYYDALADRYNDNDTAFSAFVKNDDFSSVTPDEIKEVAVSMVATVEPRYVDDIKSFIAKAAPQNAKQIYYAALDRNLKSYMQKLALARDNERDVFICHRSAAPDQDIADEVCTRLEDRGLRCWIAPRNILAGSQNYERDILKGVENCRLFLLISSYKSIYSEDCETELRAAALSGKALYSYKIDNTEYDGAFEKIMDKVQWLDGSDDPYSHLEQLVIDIKGMLAEDEREKAELERKRLEAREKERRQMEEQRNKDQERLDRLERIVTSTPQAQGSFSTPSVRSRMKRAELEVTSGDFDKAESIIDEVLDVDPENPLCWWLLLLCDYQVDADEKLVDCGDDFTLNPNYKNAERLADGNIKSRIEAVTLSYKIKIIKNISNNLDEAERYYKLEDYTNMSRCLDKCAHEFLDEDGIAFKKFPDVASRYFWLKLWAKYEQTPLICVEDITREKEYKMALQYSTPAQKIEYDKAKDTITKNAQLFLRERSKNRANDRKLVDYLVDNKNILPSDTYNYYSSLLYYRKMLTQLNMTEEMLKNSTVDISTNEYFMLATSMATEEQKTQYDELLNTLNENRERKAKFAIGSNSKKQVTVTQNGKEVSSPLPPISIARTAFAIISFVVGVILLFVGVMQLIGRQSNLWFRYSTSQLSDGNIFALSFWSGAGAFIASSIFRIVSNIFLCGIKQPKTRTALGTINLLITIVLFVFGVLACSLVTEVYGNSLPPGTVIMDYGDVNSIVTCAVWTMVLSVVGFITSCVALHKINKNER